MLKPNTQNLQANLISCQLTQYLRYGQMIQHNFLIWDIAGLEKFDHVVKNYFR
jgi:hypothetical protein